MQKTLDLNKKISKLYLSRIANYINSTARAFRRLDTSAFDFHCWARFTFNSLKIVYKSNFVCSNKFNSLKLNLIYIYEIVTRFILHWILNLFAHINVWFLNALVLFVNLMILRNYYSQIILKNLIIFFILIVFCIVNGN